jgi:acetate kinase
MRTILKATASGSERAKLALDMYCYRIKKYIGSYMASLNGADALVFTAGVGENSPTIREKSCQNLDNLGITLNIDANNQSSSEERVISIPDSKVKVFVIPTNEELMIARETVKVLTKT